MIRAVLLVLLLSLFAAPRAPGQTSDAGGEGWNDRRATELVQRAQQRRSEASADTGLADYQADARAHVFFYLDREDTGQRNLVKTDQLALEVLWRWPDLIKQRIVGWRDRKSLPTNINYHVDHLAVVMENFGDEIRIGDGDEVRDVPHPASPNGPAVYDYRLVDSLTLRLPGADEPVRVYELQVRPRDASQPAIIGSIFVERRAGDLVRMDFTFTDAAYQDRFLDYINISLDNGLWKGRFWLPNEQRVEIRRQLPQLDIPAGSVIRGTMSVGNYRFNEGLAAQRFAGPPVTVAPVAERERFPFEESIDEAVAEQGIGPGMELGEIRREAARLVTARALGEAGRLRLRLPAASEALRFNRAEGLAMAGGVSFQASPEVRTGLIAGWAFGPDHPLVDGSVAADLDPAEVALRGYANRLGDVGVGPTVAGAINSLSSLLAARDHTDPFYASGVELEIGRRVSPAVRLATTLRGERQRPAEQSTDFSLLATSDQFRPVQPVLRGDMFTATAAASREAAAGLARAWSGSAELEIATFGPDDSGRERMTYGMPRVSGSFVADVPTLGGTLLGRGSAAAVVWGEIPPQSLLLIGGRGTVPGYEFRGFGGDRFAAGSTTFSRDLVRPWLSGRGSIAAGWAGAGGASREALAAWPAEPSEQIRTSAGIGAGLLYDILHVDLWRGIGRDGKWELVIEANRAFWDFL